MSISLKPWRSGSARRAVVAVATACVALPILAAGADAAMQLQQPVPPKPQALNPAALPAPAAAASAAAGVAAGVQVRLEDVRIEGAQWIDTATLRAALGDLRGRRFDLAGLQALAAQVAAVYRAQGYAFVQALLPPQDLTDGVLRIRVVEAVYGEVTLQGDDPLAPQARPFLARALPAGDPIRDTALERAMLILDDLPGFAVRPVLSPGAHLGEGDLQVALSRTAHTQVDLGLDNAGSRATGEWRARAAMSWLSPWRLGDRLTLSALATDRGMWLGSAEYEAPLHDLAWRGAVSAACTSYQIDGALSPLRARGQADVLALRTTWTAVRSQAFNLQLGGTLQHKALHDDLGDGLLVRDKSSDAALLSAQFDRRDAFGGGGITYGVVTATAGRLHLDATSAAADADSARTAGAFTKLNLDMARIQRLPAGFSAYGRWSGQWSDGNLDASEKMSLGGFLGVRAYPMGEASGDRGWLAQVELRHALDAGTTVFVFADQGRVQVNARRWAGAGDNAGRTIAGAGLGLRWTQAPWSLEATLGTRTAGGAPTSDAADRRPRAVMVLGYRLD